MVTAGVVPGDGNTHSAAMFMGFQRRGEARVREVRDAADPDCEDVQRDP